MELLWNSQTLIGHSDTTTKLMKDYCTYSSQEDAKGKKSTPTESTGTHTGLRGSYGVDRHSKGDSGGVNEESSTCYGYQ